MQIRGLKSSELYSALYPLLEKSFTRSKESRVFYRLHQERPHAPSWKFSRVGLIDGKIVAHVGIWPFDMQLVDGVVLKCGGIRDVCTDPALRKQKLGHQMLDDATRFMENEGLDLSVLYAGPRHFYEEKGWHGSVPEYKFKVNLGAIDDSMQSTIDLVQMTGYDEHLVDEMCKIRNESSKDLTFFVIRDDSYFHRLIRTDFDFPEEGWTPYIVRERATGSCLGYLLGSIEEPSTMSIAEARVSTDESDSTYLAIFRALKTLGCSSLELQLSPNHAICKVAAKLARIEDWSSAASGVMVKFVSLERFFTKLVEAINVQVRNGKRAEVLQAISQRTCLQLTVCPEENQCEGSQEFIIDVDPNPDGMEFVRILHHDSMQEGANTASITISEEMLVTFLFAPSLSTSEAIEDGMLHSEDVDPAIVDLLFKGLSWDKERRDYF
ncbi:MAG TPA: GNAT family N-acetyltransferase [Candidatus Lokiarchaeia archaeon]|nr:GNAT family N-acetyltransferase [Candidatus Lokiarchaeia archaeon]